MNNEPYEMEGTITRIAEPKVISDRFEIIEFILHVDTEYPQDVKFQCANKKMELIPAGFINKQVRVSFYINGRGSKSGYWNTLTVYGIKDLNPGTQSVVSNHEVPPAKTEDETVPF